MEIKKSVILFSLIFFIFLFSYVVNSDIFQSQDIIISRTANTDTYRTSQGFKTVYYSGEHNYLNSLGKYVPYNYTINSLNDSNYVYELNQEGLKYKVYIKNNSNTAGAVRFEKDGYFFEYDLSGGAMSWKEKPGQPAQSDTLGSGAPSNSQDSFVKVNSNEFNYPNSFYNTNVSYIITKDMLKETFILSGLPSIKDYLYLEYSGNIKFNSSLKICANNRCYIPSGTQDDFSTSGKIEFKDDLNNTIFYLKEPIITDSNGSSTIGTYKVKGSNAQMQFGLRINKTFLSNAVYPIFIDPTITYNFNATYQGVNMFFKTSTNGANNQCLNSIPETGPIPTDCGTVVDQTSSSTLDLDDGSGITTENDGSTPRSYPFQEVIGIFSYLLNDINSFNFTINRISQSSVNAFYIWNSTGWESCGGSGSNDYYASCYKSNITNYVNSSGAIHYIQLPVSNTNSQSATTDYAQIVIIYDDIIINSPTPNQEILNSLSTTLNTSQAGYNSSIWYTWNKGIKNYTLCTLSNECQATITFPRQGYYNLTVYANKSDGTQTSKSVSNLFVGNVSKFYANQSGGKDKRCSTTTGCDDLDYIQMGGNGYRWYGIVYFNMTTLSNIIVKNASVSYYLYAFINSFDYNWGIWNVTSDWNETDNSIPNSGSIMYDSLRILSATTEWKTWRNITSLVQNKIDNPASDYGFKLDCNGCSPANHWFQVYSSESTTNPPYLNITYYSQNTAPTLTNTLSNNSNFSTSAINFTFNISDDNDYIKNVSIILDHSFNITIYNLLINNSINNTFNFSVSGIPDGLHNWSIMAFDSDNVQANSSLFTFRVDTTSPSLSIVQPIDFQSFTYKEDINVKYTVSDSGIGLAQCWWTNSSGLYNASITCGTNFSVSEAGDGNYQVTVYANDSLNNKVSSSVHYTISLTNPAITINNPSNGTFFNNGTNINFNVTATDDNGIKACQLWGNWTNIWHLNQTNSSTVTSGVMYSFNQTIKEGDGYIFNFNCSDSTNAFSFATVNFTFFVDLTKPNLTLIGPQNKTYTYTSLSLNFTYKELHNDSCWYSDNSGLTNYTLTNYNNITYTASQGSTTLRLYSNDSAKNTNSTSVTFLVDSINPSVIINASFLNGTYLNYNISIIFNLTISDTNLNKSWYHIDSNSNITINFGDNISLNLSDQNIHTLYVSANDSLGNVNNSEFLSFYLDTLAPLVENMSASTTVGSQTFSFAHQVNEKYIDTCKYTIYNSTNGIDIVGGLYLENKSVICDNPSTTETVSAYDIYTLRIYALDLAGNEGYTDKSFTVSESSGVEGPGGGGGPTKIYAKLNETCENDIDCGEGICSPTLKICIIASLCGNGICEFTLGESSLNCPEDCQILKQLSTGELFHEAWFAKFALILGALMIMVLATPKGPIRKLKELIKIPKFRRKERRI